MRILSAGHCLCLSVLAGNCVLSASCNCLAGRDSVVQMSVLSDYLQELFAGLSVAEVAQRTGIDPSFMSKILRGKAPPSFENVMRISFATGSDPIKLCELAGQNEMATLLRGVNWPSHQGNITERDLYPSEASELHRRLQRLIELGFIDQARAALSTLEAAWEVQRPVFETFARGAGAKAAALIAVMPARAVDVLFTWNCPDPKARELSCEGEAKGWSSFAYDAGDAGRLVLFLREPSDPHVKEVQAVLGVWAASLFRVSAPSAAPDR